MTEKKHNINRNTRQTLVQSVERALDILEIVGNAAEPVRMARSLPNWGYRRQPPII